MGKVGGTKLAAPEPLGEQHRVDDFCSGVASLDGWLKRRAIENERGGASRTYVVCVGRKVVGYYALAVGAVEHAGAPGRIRSNMPEPIPLMVLARLAVDTSVQGRGLGRDLLRDAVLRTVQAASIAGIRALLIHAVSDEAKAFYMKTGFTPSPIHPMTLMATLTDIRNALGLLPSKKRSQRRAL